LHELEHGGGREFVDALRECLGLEPYYIAERDKKGAGQNRP
jgi:hypothetical protein